MFYETLRVDNSEKAIRLSLGDSREVLRSADIKVRFVVVR